MPGPVEEMLLAIDRGDPQLWPLPIINDLESPSQGKAMDWATAFVELQLSRINPQFIPIRGGWMVDLRKRLADKTSSMQDFDRLCQEIWYHDSNRDEVQTAISQLYGAAGSLVGLQWGAYRKGLAFAVMSAASGPTGKPSTAEIEKLIELYNIAKGRRSDN